MTPQFLINPGATGEYAHGKTSESNCNGNLYVAWTGADDAVNIAWGSTGGAFAHKVTFNERAYYNLGTGSLPALYTSPSLTCWAPAYGPYAGVYQVWMAWTGTDQNLYFGYFDGNPSHNYLYDRSTVPNQKSYFSPTIAAFGGTIRYAWVGENDGTQGYHSGYPNFIRSDDGISWYSQNTWRAETAVGGMGFTSYCQPGGRLQSVVCLGRHR